MEYVVSDLIFLPILIRQPTNLNATFLSFFSLHARRAPTFSR